MTVGENIKKRWQQKYFHDGNVQYPGYANNYKPWIEMLCRQVTATKSHTLGHTHWHVPAHRHAS